MPPPIISPDGRLLWDGKRWVEVPRRSLSLGSVVFASLIVLALITGVGVSGYVDLSGLPVSIAVVLEHCAVRQNGTNVIVHFQGIGAYANCPRSGPAWTEHTGPPVGSLTCYSLRPLGLTWKVYDTGSMTLGTDVCRRLRSDAGLMGRH